MRGALPLIHVIANAINREKVTINDLNLFPVPDGDTGTNLALTLTSMASDIAKVPRKATPNEMLQAIAYSANNRARGNSGTILAAIISGMAEYLEDAEEVTPELLAGALESANKKSREVVMKPTEGTMLTVIQDMAVAARKACDDGATTIGQLKKPVLVAAMQATEDSAKIMRQILKRDNVGKDAGAFGLSIIVQEAIRYVTGGIDDVFLESLGIEIENAEVLSEPFPEDELWEPGTPLYCTEFSLHFHPDHMHEKPRVHLETLATFGNSEIFNVYKGVAKAHVHTDTPWDVFRHFAQFGELVFAKAENMRIQTEERQAALRANAPMKPLGVVVVASGDRVKELLIESGVDVIVDGGQTNNPEVGEIREAIIDAHAEVVIVLPGNKNVISAAKKACQMASDETGTIGITIPTTNLPENIAAMVAIPEGFSPDDDLELLTARLTDAAKKIRSASITTAVKDYSTDTVTASAGQFIAILDDKVTFAHENLLEIAKTTIQELLSEDSSFMTLYLGADFPASKKNLEKALAKVAKDIEYDIVHTDLPVYFLTISVE